MNNEVRLDSWPMDIFSLPPAFALGLALVFMVPFPALASGHVMGVRGQTYEIAEPDPIAESKEHAARVDFSAYFDKKKIRQSLMDYRPKDLPRLTRAVEARTRIVDMTYTLGFDLRDARGEMLYPKGYRFDPCRYLVMPATLVVIDGSDGSQVEWLENSGYLGDGSVKILLSDGNWHDVFLKLKRAVYYASAAFAERFHVEHVPSVVWQSPDDRAMRVVEVVVSVAGKYNDVPSGVTVKTGSKGAK